MCRQLRISNKQRVASSYMLGVSLSIAMDWFESASGATGIFTFVAYILASVTFLWLIEAGQAPDIPIKWKTGKLPQDYE